MVAQKSKALSGFAEEPGVSAAAWWLIAVYNSNSREPKASVGTRYTCTTHVYMQLKHPDTSNKK